MGANRKYISPDQVSLFDVGELSSRVAAKKTAQKKPKRSEPKRRVDAENSLKLPGLFDGAAPVLDLSSSPPAPDVVGYSSLPTSSQTADLQEPATSKASGCEAPRTTSAIMMVASHTCATTDGPSASVESPRDPAKTNKAEKSGRKQLLTISTGAEAMQARAATLYIALASAAGIRELELHSSGLDIPFPLNVINVVQCDYLKHDSSYQRAAAVHAADPAESIAQDEYRACERARKRIERAMSDLIAMGTVITDQNSNPIALLRLPDIKRTLAERGAVAVRCRPGGKRQLCDAEGNEIRPASSRKTTSVDMCTKQDGKAA